MLIGNVSHSMLGSKTLLPFVSPWVIEHFRRSVWSAVDTPALAQNEPGSNPICPKTSKVVSPLPKSQITAMESSPLKLIDEASLSHPVVGVIVLLQRTYVSLGAMSASIEIFAVLLPPLKLMNTRHEPVVAVAVPELNTSMALFPVPDPSIYSLKNRLGAVGVMLLTVA